MSRKSNKPLPTATMSYYSYGHNVFAPTKHSMYVHAHKNYFSSVVDEF